MSICPTCGGTVTDDEATLSINEILLEVCAHFGMSLAEMKSHRRLIVFARPRQIAMYFCREKTLQSYPAIGRIIGGRDHTTILSGIKSLEKRLAEDLGLQRDVDAIRKKLEAKMSPPGGEFIVVDLMTRERL